MVKAISNICFFVEIPRYISSIVLVGEVTLSVLKEAVMLCQTKHFFNSSNNYTIDYRIPSYFLAYFLVAAIL